MAKTATDLIDDLVEGRATLTTVAEQLADWQWTSPVDHDNHTGDDVEAPDDNSWDAVATDPRLSASEYAMLARAFAQSQGADLTAAGMLTFKFDPRQPRDSEGKWTDGADVDLPDFPKSSGQSKTAAKPTGKKVTPAVIYKKHADGAVVGESSNRRMRWSAPAKKFVVEERQDGSWQETSQLTKTAAYDEMKQPDRWFEPGTVTEVDGSQPATTQRAGQPGQVTKIQLQDVPDLLDEAVGTDERDEYIRRALGGLDEFGPKVATTYISRDDGGKLTGAMTIVDHVSDAEDAGVSPYSVIDYIGARGDGAGKKLVQRAIKHALDTNTVIMAEPTANSEAFWKKMGFRHDPLSEGTDFHGLSYDEAVDWPDTGQTVPKTEQSAPPETPEHAPADSQPSVVNGRRRLDVSVADADSQSSGELTVKERVELNEVQKSIKALHDAGAVAREIDAKITHKSGTGGVLNDWELKQQEKARATLDELTAQAIDLSERELELRIKRDGSPWGTAAGQDDARWAQAGAPKTMYEPGVDREKMEKIADSYRINDKKTIEHNASLRTGEPTQAAKSWRTRISRLINSQRMQSDAIVYRGAALRPEMLMNFRPGAILRDKGTMSTDKSRDIAQFYVKTRANGLPGTIPMVMEIRVPKGMPAADVLYGEYVFDVNTPIRVISSSRGKKGIVQVVAEVLTPEQAKEISGG